jgi:S-adenosylmethionine/arginine decarboxylase-like enzyme
LPYNKNTSNIEIRDRDIASFNMVPYNKDGDFGPHILLDLEATSLPNMETFFDFLENLVSKINMDPICRTTVLKSSPVNPKYLSAIIVIAQSHISLHYNYETEKIYADIFSCAPFDYSSLDQEFKDLGTIISNELVVRGTKHIDRVKSIKEDDLKDCYTYWQRVLNKK